MVRVQVRYNLEATAERDDLTFYMLLEDPVVYLLDRVLYHTQRLTLLVGSQSPGRTPRAPPCSYSPSKVDNAS